MTCIHCGHVVEPTELRSPTGQHSQRVVCWSVYQPEVATPVNDGYEPSGMDEFVSKEESHGE